MSRLSTRAREELYDAEAAKARSAGRGNLPVCNICNCPIDGVRQAWDASHDPAKPNWLGGAVTGIAHRRCNRAHNNHHDTPRYAKSRRQRQMNIGARQSRMPLPGGRDDRIRKKMNGDVVERATGRMLSRRGSR